MITIGCRRDQKKESEQYVDHLFAVTGDLPIKKEDAGSKGILFYQKSLNSASTSAAIVVATSKAAVTTAAED